MQKKVIGREGDIFLICLNCYSSAFCKIVDVTMWKNCYNKNMEGRTANDCCRSIEVKPDDAGLEWKDN